MGKLWSRLFKRHDNEGNNADSSLSESDESTDDESTEENDNKTPKRRRRRVKKEEPTDGWEEICGIDIDVLEDIMAINKHKITHSNKYISVKDIKVPSIEQNRERLSSAYNLWQKYCREDCQVFMPKWERILERPVVEQSVLVEEYVRKVFYLLELEEVPEYNIPEDIKKKGVLIRDPNRPGTFIELNDALKPRKQSLKKSDSDFCKEVLTNIPSSSRFNGGGSNPSLDLLNRHYSHHTV